MIYPVGTRYPITQRFGENPADYKRFGLAGHNGVDWAVPEGTAVLAADSGIVVKSRFDPGGYGNYVEIEHAGGLRTIYAHLSGAKVRENQFIEGGMLVGLSGNTGNSIGPHLHFTVKLKGEEKNGYSGAVDPMPYLQATPAPEVKKGYARVVSAAGLNLRAEPNGAFIALLKDGQTLRLADGVEPVTTGGYTWRAVVLWVADQWIER